MQAACGAIAAGTSMGYWYTLSLVSRVAAVGKGQEYLQRSIVFLEAKVGLLEAKMEARMGSAESKLDARLAEIRGMVQQLLTEMAHMKSEQQRQSFMLQQLTASALMQVRRETEDWEDCTRTSPDFPLTALPVGG